MASTWYAVKPSLRVRILRELAAWPWFFIAFYCLLFPLPLLGILHYSDLGLDGFGLLLVFLAACLGEDVVDRLQGAGPSGAESRTAARWVGAIVIAVTFLSGGNSQHLFAAVVFFGLTFPIDKCREKRL